MPWPKTGATHYHAKFGLLGQVLCNKMVGINSGSSSADINQFESHIGKNILAFKNILKLFVIYYNNTSNEIFQR